MFGRKLEDGSLYETQRRQHGIGCCSVLKVNIHQGDVASFILESLEWSAHEEAAERGARVVRYEPVAVCLERAVREGSRPGATHIVELSSSDRREADPTHACCLSCLQVQEKMERENAGLTLCLSAWTFPVRGGSRPSPHLRVLPHPPGL